ncbi:hypothetical protein CVS53_03619 [Microbacterium oxydans]|nr:hypothetical protein CVS53_03619 [Microbacterium oxydans]
MGTGEPVLWAEATGYVGRMSTQKPTFTTPESELFPDDAEPSSPVSTREAFIERSRSGYTKLRHEFVQVPASSTGGAASPAMLPIFARNHRAAVLYLALLTNWPWLGRSGEALAADTWIRFLSSDKTGSLTWTAQSLSHAWKVLEDAKLVERTLVNRLKKVTPLRESGSGEPYTSPDGDTGGLYVGLPHTFWTDELHATLSWPALAVLLILLKETSGRPSAELPVDKAEKYYGISRTTAEAGLAELRDKELLLSANRWVQDHVAGEGRRWTSLHALLGPYSTAQRHNLQGAAKKRHDEARAKTAATKTRTAATTTTVATTKRADKKKTKKKKVVNDEHSAKVSG